MSQPPQDPGLRERVVRVRYDAMPEPQEVGTLLTPRLVLTVGDAALGPRWVAWVRAGDREVSCRAVWWDDALPRVFLLLADEDLADPAAWPLPWAEADAGRARVRVDGRTDRGEAVALTGEVVPYDGARNGELVRLSNEPESWTHFRGGPVSHDGELLGVVHGVWPDRMVFLSGRALAEQPGFREGRGCPRPGTRARWCGWRCSPATTARTREGARRARRWRTCCGSSWGTLTLPGG